MSNPNRPPEADLPQAVPLTAIFQISNFTTGTDRLLIDNGISTTALRRFRPEEGVPASFFRDHIIDPTLYTRQKFDSNSLFFLLSGQLEVKYTDTAEIVRITSGFYNSSGWASYRTFWDQDRDCSIAPSPNFNLVHIKRIGVSSLNPEYNDFNNLDITVKKLEDSSETFTVANNSCLFVVNTNNNFVLQSDGETFDLASRPSTSNLTFQPHGLDDYYYNNEKVFKFLVSGVTTVSTTSPVYLILLSPKS